jgi:putative CocE/NonD family hydrolase
MKLSKSYFLILFLFSFSSIFISESFAQPNEIDILFQKKIPMRDGVNLSATIYKPSNLKSPLPVILMITPYVSYFNPEYGPYYAERGFAFVYVDTRGRGNSEGEFKPFESDGKDGYDVVEWLAEQPWCNGKIGMMGQSYRGMVQWFTLKEFPPSLHSIAPTASVAPGINFPYIHNIFMSWTVQLLGLVHGRTNNVKVFGSPYWAAKNRKVYKEYIAFSKIDSITGIDRKIFQKWIKHPGYDEYWENMVPSRNDYEKMNIPILTVTGYFDDAQASTLHYYRNFFKYASDEAKNMHYLVIGPWSHNGTIWPQSELGGLKFGENAVIDIKKIHLDWFNWTLKNQEKSEFFKENVYFYVMGDNKWEYTSSFEKISDESMTLYFSSNQGQAQDVFNSGKLLSVVQDNQVPDTIVHDPLDVIYINQTSSNDYYLKM